MRFLSVIKDPGRLYSDHEVIDLIKCKVLCVCSDERDADMIAKVLSIHAEERSKAIEPEGDLSLADLLSEGGQV